MMAITPTTIQTLYIVPANVTIILSPKNEQMPLKACFTAFKPFFIQLTMLLRNDFGFEVASRDGSDEQRLL